MSVVRPSPRALGVLSALAFVLVSLVGIGPAGAVALGIKFDWTCSGNTCGNHATTAGGSGVYTADFTSPAFVAGANKYLAVAVSFSDPANSVSSVVLDPAGVNVSLANIGSRDNDTSATCEITLFGGTHSVTSGTKTIRVTTNTAMRVVVGYMSFSNVLNQTYNQVGGNYFNGKGTFTSATSALVSATNEVADYLFGGTCASRTAPTDSTYLLGTVTTYNSEKYVLDDCLDSGFDCTTMEAGTVMRACDNDTSSDLKFDYNASAGGKRAIGVLVLEPTYPSAIRLDDFAVTRSGSRVRVGWRTGLEVDSLGFHLYRDDGRGRVRLTSAPILGSSMLTGMGIALNAGQIYTFDDDSAADPSGNARYWLEEIDMNGQRTSYGPARGAVPVAGQSMFDPALAGASSPLVAQAAEMAEAPPAPAEAVPAALSMGQEHPAHWAMAAGAAVKLGIDHAGWYEVGRAALIAAGLDANVDPRRLGLFVEGREVPMQVRGEGDGVFDASDAIGFYGRGQNAPTTDTRVYWVAALDHAGLRMPEAAQPPRTPAALDHFSATVEARPRTIYFTPLRNGDESNFFGPPIGPTPVMQRLRAQHLVTDPTDQPVLEVGLQGASEVAHKVAVTVDGVAVGTVELDKRERRSFEVPIPGPLSADGVIEVGLAALGGETDVTLLDFIRLRHPRALVADAGVLTLSAAGGAALTVTGFPGNAAIEAIDLSDESAPGRIVVDAADATGSVGLVVPGAGARRLLVRARDHFETPRFTIPNRPSNWNAAQAGGDLLVIGRADWLPALAPWKAMREAQGWTVALVDIEDVYDEFSFGAKHPDAIRSLIARATQRWTHAPRAVVLVGDATFDPRDFLGKGNFDIVPTKLVDTALFETGSDDWFTDFDGDGAGDIAVGRLPARTKADVESLTAKWMAAPVFDSPEAAAGAGPMVFVSDQNDELYDFHTASTALQAATPLSLRPIVVDRNQDVDAAAHVAQAWAQQPLFMSYVGHGSQELWAGGLLSTDGLANLASSGPGAFVSPMTCLNGFFQDVNRPSLAESLLALPAGGAFGVWASSGFTEVRQQAAMARAFAHNLTMQAMTAGEAARQAKTMTRNIDVRRTWILFGDPTWQMFRAPGKAPPDAAPAASDATADGGAQDSPAVAPGDNFDAGGSAARPAVASSTDGCACDLGGGSKRADLPVLLLPALGLVWRRLRRRRQASVARRSPS
jgi:hypothetical protein